MNTNVREFAISKIKEGQPVLLFLGSTSGCHFVVAYDLNDNGTENDTSDDKIYAHYGGYGDKVHIDIDTDKYPLLISAMAFNFTMEHSHSNNYLDLEGNQYCSCYFPSYPNHVHEYEPCGGVENVYHTYKCGCLAINDSYVSLHNFEYTKITENGHQEICAECGYERPFGSHVFQHSNITESEHTNRCISCDYTITQPHSLVYTSIGDNSHTQICTDCEYTETQSHNLVCDVEGNSLHYVECADCGYRVNKIENPEYTSLNSTQHEVSCPDCDYTETLEHNLVYESLDKYTHGMRCSDCGYVSSSSSHVFVYTPMLGNRHKKSCLCGYSVTEACIGRTLIGGMSYCMNCGEEMDAFPEFLSIDDEEALLLGIVADLPPDNKEDEYYTE